MTPRGKPHGRLRTLSQGFFSLVRLEPSARPLLSESQSGFQRTRAQHLNETRKSVTHTLPKAPRRYSPYSYDLSHPFLGVGRFSAISLPMQLIFELSQKLLKTKTLLRAPDGLRDQEIKRWAQHSYESSQPQAARHQLHKTLTVKLKQVHAKLSSISTISQSSIYKTPKTKIKLPQDSFSNSPKTSLQRFFVSSFLREFSESPTKIHVSSFRGAVR